MIGEPAKWIALFSSTDEVILWEAKRNDISVATKVYKSGTKAFYL
jgi:hypothetical protein